MMEFMIFHSIVTVCLFFILPRYLYNQSNGNVSAAGVGFFASFFWFIILCVVALVLVLLFIVEVIMYILIPEYRPKFKNNCKEFIRDIRISIFS